MNNKELKLKDSKDVNKEKADTCLKRTFRKTNETDKTKDKQ